MKKIHESENMSSVIQSPAMQAPPPNKMLAYHSDPIQKNPATSTQSYMAKRQWKLCNFI